MCGRERFGLSGEWRQAFAQLGQYQGIKIVSPADFIQMQGQHGRGR